MRLITLAITAGFLSLSPALASPWPVHVEYQRGRTLIVEHTPVPGTVSNRVVRSRVVVKKRRVARSAQVRRVHRTRVVAWRYTGVAGGCRDGGLVRREAPGGTLVLQREICRDVIPYGQ